MGRLSTLTVSVETSVSVNPNSTSKEFDVWRCCKITCIVARDPGVRLVFFFFPIRGV